jgi:mannitol-specific phosphotransferase system IIBC component
MNEPAHTRATTAGGVLAILLANINSADILKTVVLAVTGAIVSFTVSLLIKKAADWLKARKG